jgi:hypothetical protein
MTLLPRAVGKRFRQATLTSNNRKLADHPVHQ